MPNQPHNWLELIALGLVAMVAGALDYLHRHGIITMLVIVWGICLTTYVTVRVFSDAPPNVPTGTAAAFTTLFGLPSLAIGLWKWRLDK